MPDAPRHSWLVLVHHLPPRPTRLRVRVWRQLQKLGALAIKNSVYVLPASDRTLEDFTWLQQEINVRGGGAVVFRAQAAAGATDAEIAATFRQARKSDYERLTAALGTLARRIAGRRRGPDPAESAVAALEGEVDAMQNELTRIKELDVFGSPGRREASSLLERCRRLLRAAQGRAAGSRGGAGGRSGRRDPAQYQGRLWVTRPRPHIDRCASAWLIRGFIDRRARFAFAAPDAVPRRGIPYDMAGCEFGHQGEDCTFETLVKVFGLGGDPGLRAIAEIVHDVDLKDDKFGRMEGAGINTVLRGLEARLANDQALLREAGKVFDGLYATLADRPARGRSGARTRRR